MTNVLIVDSHEPIEIKNGLKDVNTRCEQLNVGDFIYQDVNKNIQLVIERKTICDLQASIVDGRFREQRQRLLELNSKVIYIIEGKMVNNNCISGALENMALYHNICIIPTMDIHQTIYVLKSLYKKVSKEYIQPSLSLFNGRKRGEQLNKSNLEFMLETISGVSPAISKAIYNKYPTIKILTEKLTENPNVLYGTEISPKRKIGLKLAEKIGNSFIK